MRLSLSIVAFGAFVVLTAPPAGAAEATKEISTAAIHAGMAAGSDNPKMVQTHLQHVINCLEGPAGANFNAGPGNPCKDFGAGAIPDSAPDQRKRLETAAAMAKAAQGEADPAKARAMAKEIQAGLSK